MKALQRFFILTLLSLSALLNFSCSEKVESDLPVVFLEGGVVTDTTVSFTVGAENASECYYYCSPEDTPEPDAEFIFSNGTALDGVAPRIITVSGLVPETSYRVYAAARGTGRTVLSEPVVLVTLKKSEQPDVKLELVEVTQSSFSFKITPYSSEKCAYYCVPLFGSSVVNAEIVFEKGVMLDKLQEQTVKVDGLEADTEYLLYAASSSGNKTDLCGPLQIKTSREPIVLELELSDMQATYNSISFNVTSSDADRGRYDFFVKDADFQMPDVSDILGTGKKLKNLGGKEEVVLSDLKEDTDYYVFVAIASEDPESGEQFTKMESFEIRTEKRPAPEELPEETFTECSLVIYSGRNYVLESENDGYRIKLDFYGSKKPEYLPHIEAHRYAFMEGYNPAEEWMLNNISSVTEKSSGKSFKLIDGEIDVKYTAPDYEITGRFVTDDNKAFNFRIDAQIPYPLNISSGEIVAADGAKKMVLAGNYHTLELDFAGTEISGDKQVGTDIMTSSVLKVTGSDQSFGLASGGLDISVSEDIYNISGDIVLENGDIVSVKAENIRMSEPEEPEETVIEFTEASATGKPDQSGWLSEYSLTLGCADYSAVIVFSDFGDFDELPSGNYTYVSWGGGDVISFSMNKLTDPKDDFRDIDEGKVTISKSGDEYVVEFNMERSSGKAVAGKYEGKIVCTDASEN